MHAVRATRRRRRVAFTLRPSPCPSVHHVATHMRGGAAMLPRVCATVVLPLRHCVCAACAHRRQRRHYAAIGPGRPSSTTNRASLLTGLSACNGSAITRKLVVQSAGVMSARP